MHMGGWVKGAGVLRVPVGRCSFVVVKRSCQVVTPTRRVAHPTAKNVLL